MPLLPILLIAAVMMVDSGLTPLGSDWSLSREWIAVWTIAPVVVIVSAVEVVFLMCERQLKKGRSARPFFMAERAGRWGRTAIVLNHFAALMVLGWLGAVRSYVGNPILVDEIIAILPAMTGIVLIWWAHYPIDRRVHDAMLIRRLDEGRTLYPMLSRAGFVLLQTRLHLLLVLVPVLVIAGLSEVFNRASDETEFGRSFGWALSIGKFVVAAGVFLIAPWLARLVLDVRIMAEGPLRQMLLEVAHHHRVVIRELLVWRTNGTVFNAAVMGLIGRLRYVLITDALLESLQTEQIRAVMAHEIGHVRRRHMAWLVVCLLASFALAGAVILPVAYGLDHLDWLNSQAAVDGGGLVMSGIQLIIGLAVFGWVCRRFERQADTFAVQHLSRYPSEHGAVHSIERGDQSLIADSAAQHQSFGVPVNETVTADAVHSMCDALDAIARLNAIEHHRPSWRHGSIAWRMEYLVSLIGQPLPALPIDRTMARIKVAAAIIVCGAVAYSIFAHVHNGGFAS